MRSCIFTAAYRGEEGALDILLRVQPLDSEAFRVRFSHGRPLPGLADEALTADGFVHFLQRGTFFMIGASRAAAADADGAREALPDLELAERVARRIAG